MKWRTYPSSLRRGGCAIKKKLRSILYRADGVVISHNQNSGGMGSPPRPLHKGCFAIIYCCRVHPSSGRRGKFPKSALVNSLKARDYRLAKMSASMQSRALARVQRSEDFGEIEGHEAVSTATRDPELLVNRIQVDSRRAFPFVRELTDRNSPSRWCIPDVIDTPNAKRAASAAVDDPAFRRINAKFVR